MSPSESIVAPHAGGSAGGLLEHPFRGRALVTVPVGAASQKVLFSLTPATLARSSLGTSTSGESIVTNNSAAPLYFISASPSKLLHRRRVPCHAWHVPAAPWPSARPATLTSSSRRMRPGFVPRRSP